MLGLCALIVAVAMVSIGVTLAYAPVTAYETNVVVLGNISIRLNDKYYSYINTPDDIEDEDTDPGDIVYDTDAETPYNEDEPPTFSPGQTVRKVVSVTNTGDHPCYVRLLVRKIWEDKDNNDISDLIELNINKAYWYTEGETYTVTKNDEQREYVLYYYKDILDVGETTQPLIRNFTIKDYSKTSVYAGGFDKVVGTKGDIQVMAQAVQSENVKCTPPNLGGTIIQAKAPIGYYDEDPDIVYVQKWNIVFD